MSAKYEGLENREVSKVFVSSCIKNGEDLEIEKNETIETGDLLLSTVKSVEFTLKDVAETMETVPVVEPPRSAFDIMMNKKLQPLAEMKGTDKHTELHNTVVKDVGVILRPRTGQVNGERVLKMVTNAFWYLGGRGAIINEASKKRKQVKPIPERFAKYTGFQDWVKWKKKPRVEVKDCELHSENLLNAANSTGVSWPGEWGSDIIRLSNSLSTYASELRKANEKQQERQSQLYPVRQISKNAAVAKDKVDEKFSKLSSVMSEMENEVPILVMEEDHFTDILTPMQKYRLYKDVVSLEVSVMVIRYDPGGGCPLIVFMKRVDSSFSEDARYNIAMKMLATIEPDIPKYHTRSMRRQFKKTIDIIIK